MVVQTEWNCHNDLLNYWILFERFRCVHGSQQLNSTKLCYGKSFCRCNLSSKLYFLLITSVSLHSVIPIVVDYTRCSLFSTYYQCKFDLTNRPPHSLTGSWLTTTRGNECPYDLRLIVSSMSVQFCYLELILNRLALMTTYHTVALGLRYVWFL